MPQSILILGSKGMLGQALVEVFSADESYDVTAWDREDIDVTDENALKEKVTALWPDIIVNAIAYNNVDGCEEDDAEHEKAIALNVTLPENLSKIANTLRAKLVHYSTDYVFDGKRPEYGPARRPQGCCGSGCDGCQYNGAEDTIEHIAYREDDVPKPLSRYGKTKFDGEQVIAKNTNEHFIIRLSKLFGAPGSSELTKVSFFETIARIAKEKGEVAVIDAETSKFTYAPDLASATKELLESDDEFGIYHLPNEGVATWLAGAKEFFAITKEKAKLSAAKPGDMPRAAQRPASSVLLNTKRPELRDYRDALTEHYKN